MSEEKLVFALQELVNYNPNNLGALASPGRTIETRIAAIILFAARTHHLPISVSACRLIDTLLNIKDDDAVDPTETPVGAKILQMANAEHNAPFDFSRLSQEELETLQALLANIVQEPEWDFSDLAWKVVKLSSDFEACPDEQLDYLLQRHTGKDGMWWVLELRKRFPPKTR